MTSSSEMTARPRVRFERNASRVVFDPGSRSFVVTWSKCNKTADERISSRKDQLRWLPSVGAVTTLYDRGVVKLEQNVCAAAAIGRAWDAGDRELLDTEEAKKAAALVRDVASVCGNATSAPYDAGLAIRHLVDEMSAVRFSEAEITREIVDGVLKRLDKAAEECLSVDGIRDWSPRDIRRKFLFCMKRKECTELVYSLLSLLFGTGACPLLSMSDRLMIRERGIASSGLSDSFDCLTVGRFFRSAANQMLDMKNNGLDRLNERPTQRQVIHNFLKS